MLIFPFRCSTDVSSGRLLNIWAGAFTPAFLKPATQQRTTADFGMTCSSWFENLGRRSFAIREAISCRAITGKTAWARSQSDRNGSIWPGSARRPTHLEQTNLLIGASWLKPSQCSALTSERAVHTKRGNTSSTVTIQGAHV